MECITVLDNMEPRDSMENAEYSFKFIIAYDLTFQHGHMGFDIYINILMIRSIFSDAFEFTSLDRNTDDWLRVPIPHVCLLIIIVMTITARRGLGVN